MECLQLIAICNEATVELSSEKIIYASKIPLVRQMHQKILEWRERLTSPTALQLSRNLQKKLSDVGWRL